MIRYFPVTSQGEVIGYLWASEDEVDFVRVLAAQHDTFAAAIAWYSRRDRARAEGLSPLQTLNRWVGVPEDPVAGGIASDAMERRVPDLNALEVHANPDYVRPPSLEPPTSVADPWDPNPEESSPFTLEKAGYSFLTEGPIRYVPVTRGGHVLGYLWVSETEDAASYIPREAAGVEGIMAGRVWKSRLDNSKKVEGLSPMQALHRWTGKAEDPVAGAVPADVEPAEAASVEDLERWVNGMERRG
jgi:hypothetical protein